MDAAPFSVHVPDDVLEDLRSRLRHTRWPGPLPYPGWTAGADLNYLKDLIGYWPSSFVELLNLVPLLTDPAAHGGDERDSFDVVIPSLPGYAFSPPPNRPGACTARTWANL
jgi:hypothetical protein